MQILHMCGCGGIGLKMSASEAKKLQSQLIKAKQVYVAWKDFAGTVWNCVLRLQILCLKQIPFQGRGIWTSWPRDMWNTEPW